MHGPKLGELIETNEHRDAIHIAVLPVTISDEEPLDPGTPVCFKIVGNSEIVCKAAWHRAIGIIDPFLKRKVKIGEMCWMFMMPNTITSLRHEWEHPAVDGVDRKGISEFWLRDFADDLGVAYEDMMQQMIANKGSGASFGDDINYQTDEREEEFRKHFEIVTGILPPNRPEFRCAC